MRRIRNHLNLISVLILTAALTISGAISYFHTQQRLESELLDYQNRMKLRMETVVPGVLWNFDDIQLARILDSEMSYPGITGIEIYNGDAFLDGRKRTDDGEIVKLNKAELGNSASKFPLNYSGAENPKTLGQVHFVTNRSLILQQLREQVIEKIIEILILDLLVVFALSRSLQQIVIRPLALLRDRLNQIAERDGSYKDIDLPRNPYQEIDEVSVGYNRIAHRLQDDVTNLSRTEAAMRQAKEDAESALLQLKEAQKNLVQSEKMASLGSLVAGIAHEINTPVGVILTSASVLHDESIKFHQMVEGGQIKKSEVISYSDTAEQSSALILSNAARAADLIQSFKRVAVDQTSEVRRDFELHAYLNEIMTSLRPLIKHMPVSIQIECTEHIKMDSFPGAFSQILTNLLNNALLHAFHRQEDQLAEEHNLITISAYSDQEWVMLNFADNGVGIPAAIVDKIFDPFFTTKRANGGSGLGLNIVFNLVTQTLGGSIKVFSEEGKGTRFEMKIPSHIQH
ncbi:HAMP domain-containing histidine kinase [Chitinibacter fontanus]|uniref:histidine kinase n=1 Tax=Chitinibacter fontanus TaxID=1737446 RepID=A0A7D5Z6V6_9NEIS|nr:HAMP domain-containing sensor histidine kinase [Chitinibacter fontanus]QLI83101.1 HAMP domain-containing histidine kinase [Chitinibacter fontanus]